MNPSAPITFRSYWPFLTAALISGFLFYIDEGLYSFAWMKNPGGWLVFFFYTVAIGLGPFLYLSLLRPRHLWIEKVLSMALLGGLGFYLLVQVLR